MTAQYKLLGGMDKKSDFFSTAWRVWVEHFIGTRMAQKIVRIDETTREAVQRVISNNVGVPRREIAKQLTMFNRKRAMTIARTEVAQMAVESQRQGAEAWKARQTRRCTRCGCTGERKIHARGTWRWMELRYRRTICLQLSTIRAIASRR